jgi:hypothetical protein
MANEQNNYKKVYIVDMARLKNNKVTTLLMGNILPIVNQADATKPTFKEFSERCARKCINLHDILAAALGEETACTIIEYLDGAGKPIVTLFPTNDIDLHKNDWTNLSPAAFDDLHRTINERNAMMTKYKRTIQSR